MQLRGAAAPASAGLSAARTGSARESAELAQREHDEAQRRQAAEALRREDERMAEGLMRQAERAAAQQQTGAAAALRQQQATEQAEAERRVRVARNLELSLRSERLAQEQKELEEKEQRVRQRLAAAAAAPAAPALPLDELLSQLRSHGYAVHPAAVDESAAAQLRALSESAAERQRFDAEIGRRQWEVQRQEQELAERRHSLAELEQQRPVPQTPLAQQQAAYAHAAPFFSPAVSSAVPARSSFGLAPPSGAFSAPYQATVPREREVPALYQLLNVPFDMDEQTLISTQKMRQSSAGQHPPKLKTGEISEWLLFTIAFQNAMGPLGIRALVENPGVVDKYWSNVLSVIGTGMAPTTSAFSQATVRPGVRPETALLVRGAAEFAYSYILQGISDVSAAKVSALEIPSGNARTPCGRG